MRYNLSRKKGDIFDCNPELKLHDEFAQLTDRQMRFVINYADPESPYAAYPERKRRQRAALAAGYKVMNDKQDILDPNGADIVNGKVASIEKAVEKYKEIVSADHEEAQEMIDAVQKQIDNIMSTLKAESSDADELKKRSALAKELPLLKQTIRELQEKSGMSIVEADTDNQEEVGQRELSILDKVNMEAQEDI